MFGKIVQGMKTAKKGTEVHRLLMKNYNLTADLERLHRFIGDNALTNINPHDVAIAYAADQVDHMDPSNPEHVRLGKKFLRVAKQAHAVGAAHGGMAMQQLTSAIEDRLGIDPDTIEAAPY